MKHILFVVDDPTDWTLEVPGVEVVSAENYLTGKYQSLAHVRVFNLCRSYRYRADGYYVSLLAAARGHKPVPDVATIQDMKSQTIVRSASDELDELIQKSLSSIRSKEFTLSIYFGQNLARRYEKLSRHLFNLFHAPLLRAHFVRNHKWHLQRVGPISMSEIPPDHHSCVVRLATEFFRVSHKRTTARAAPSRYDLAILWSPDEEFQPSDEKAIKRFGRAAEALGFGVDIIHKNDYSRLAEFDALFIRETTSVNHHTYRFARRAMAEGLVVIDDPESILRCTNKVYLAELLDRHHIPAPKTVIVHRGNLDEVVRSIGFPCILKQPDSSFSQGVVKADNQQAMLAQAAHIFERTELAIAQEFVPTDFDWRIGVLDRRAIYACKYHMARRHWQIRSTDQSGRSSYGRVEAVALDGVPSAVLRTALKAANLIGDGLYGVDLKELGGKPIVIEVNDNPSIDAGTEDGILKNELYRIVMQCFLERVERRKAEGVVA